jgi:hypothetical protein
MSTQAVTPRPEFGKIFGITYDKNTRLPMVRTPRVLKVGIGIPKGKAVHIFMHNGDWIIRFGVWEKSGDKNKLVMKTVYRGNSKVKMGDSEVILSNKRADVEAWYAAHKQDAAVSNRPQKIPHFTFTRRTIVEDEGGKPVEVFEPDFEAIEAHGDSPRRIPIMLMADNPLSQELAFWSAIELKCHGDGLLAERVVSMGSAKDENWKAAKDAGDKMFVYSPCGTSCPYLGKECKPHSVLNMQLAYALRIGATAYFTTTGMVSAGQLFSSLTDIAEAVHNKGISLRGIPMDLVLSSFRANHEGKPSVQPCVFLDLRASSRRELDKILSDNAWVPVRLENGVKQIEAPISEAGAMYDAEAETLAPAINAEFSEPEFDDDEPVTVEASPAATATQAKTEALSEKIRKTREGTAPVATPKDSGAAQSAVTKDPGGAQNEIQQAGPAAPSIPWTDRPTMNSALTAQKARIGQEAYDGLLAKHNVMMGALKFDDPKAAALYADMVAAPMAVNDGDVF